MKTPTALRGVDKAILGELASALAGRVAYDGGSHWYVWEDGEWRWDAASKRKRLVRMWLRDKWEGPALSTKTRHALGLQWRPGAAERHWLRLLREHGMVGAVGTVLMEQGL